MVAVTCKEEKVATIHDIAELAGVSAMTVSRVIKGSTYVSEEKRLRVEKAIKKLDYHPNRVARTLASKRSDIIIAVIPDIENAFFTELVKGTQEVTDLNGYNIILCDSRGQVDKEKASINFAMERMADGILLFCPRVDDEYLSSISKQIPTVVVDRKVKDKKVDQVYIDNKEGAQAAVEYLISQGHRRIGLMEGPSNVLANQRRKEGYKAALRSHGISIDEKLMVDGLFSFSGGAMAFTQYMSLKNRPTAVFSTNDWMAIGFIQRAHEWDVSIPDDISIIGFDNIILSGLINPSLTTVRHPKVEMGKAAAYLLLKKLNVNVEIPTLEMKNELIIRNSVKNIKNKGAIQKHL